MPITIAALAKALPVVKDLYSQVQAYRKNNEEVAELARRLDMIIGCITALEEDSARLDPASEVLQDEAIDNLNAYILKGLDLVNSFPVNGKIAKFVLAPSTKTDIEKLHSKLSTYESGLTAFCSVKILKNVGKIEEKMSKQASQPQPSRPKIVVEGVAKEGRAGSLEMDVGGRNIMPSELPASLLDSESRLASLSSFQAKQLAAAQKVMESQQDSLPDITATGVAPGAIVTGPVKMDVGGLKIAPVKVVDEQPADPLIAKVLETPAPGQPAVVRGAGSSGMFKDAKTSQNQQKPPSTVGVSSSRPK